MPNLSENAIGVMADELRRVSLAVEKSRDTLSPDLRQEMLEDAIRVSISARVLRAQLRTPKVEE